MSETKTARRGVDEPVPFDKVPVGVKEWVANGLKPFVDRPLNEKMLEEMRLAFVKIVNDLVEFVTEDDEVEVIQKNDNVLEFRCSRRIYEVLIKP